MQVRLTQYSHGAGCGCKIAPGVLETIIAEQKAHGDGRLIVGNSTHDDAAVYDLGNGQGLISTTDFFMPIVDDPETFGRIAAVNAISDVYAMGGRPILAIAILGWPIDKIPAEVAGQVIFGARMACAEAGIALAGGHSIDSPEPIFGLAVNGLVDLRHLKRNDTARPGDLLLLTKPLGVGILTTAEKRGLLSERDAGLAARQMMILNRVGGSLGALDGVHAMTDVTGFGLLGHLLEVCEGSGLRAELWLNQVPLMTNLDIYLDQHCIPGGTQRNWTAYGARVADLPNRTRWVLCDPQTSGGLLLSVAPSELERIQNVLRSHELEAFVEPIGHMASSSPGLSRISVSGHFEPRYA